ncbi:hypothetical protein OSB04_003957 [Centaurea solstitialis]|uniref:Uncharacterized protein n=1 Tax=Centaurea solstitialis TaxID=347529 RepID=A0AA38U8C7_9ASTR|nr:hypothetical protein OSB04_003957 [Centaurea solstitialis]
MIDTTMINGLPSSASWQDLKWRKSFIDERLDLVKTHEPTSRKRPVEHDRDSKLFCSINGESGHEAIRDDTSGRSRKFGYKLEERSQ